MTIDQSKVGAVAADLMDQLEDAYGEDAHRLAMRRGAVLAGLLEP